MNSLSDISMFAVVFAVNLFLLGALLAGGLAVVLRVTENVSPRFRYLFSIAVFLMAIFVPLAATALKNPAGQNAIIGNDLKPKDENEISVWTSRILIDKAADSNLPPASWKSNGAFVNDFVLTLTNSFAGDIFLSVWVLGGLLLFLRKLVGILRLAQSRKYWTRASEFDKKSFDCPKNILLYLADDQTPGTIGWFNPAIVLPREFPVEVSLEAKRFIVRHELSHTRWRDPFFRFLLRAIRNLFWISPALWLIERLIITECEAAADRAAIGGSAENRNSQMTALNYAETLFSIAKSFKSVKPRNRQPQIVGIGAGGDLEIRIRRLLSSRRTTRRQIGTAVCACFLTALMTTLIPVASFFEIVRETKSQNSFSADNQNNLSTIKNTGDWASENSFDVMPQAKIFSGSDKSFQARIVLEKADNKKLPSNEQASTSKPHQEHRDSSSASVGDDTAKSLLEATNNVDARNADREKNQPVWSDTEAVENLPATGDFGTPVSRLETPEPARNSSVILPDGGKPARLKNAAESGGRRNYSPNLPALATAAKYIPYAVGQREP